MAIPRLPPAANQYTTDITVNERERPYFELFYQAKKKPGETPDEFAKRLIAMDVRNYHISQ